MKAEPPGDDVRPTPDPVTEEPPHDRFCDLVLTGGVASGVVYPWAIVELARAYRFRNIGGTSVGAMAAALAAAAEYGRRTGHETAFEVLRRLPGALGTKLHNDDTRLFSLFQPGANGSRLLQLWRRLFDGNSCRGMLRILSCVLRAYRVEIGIGVIVGQSLSLVLTTIDGPSLLVMALLATGGAFIALIDAIIVDIRAGITDHNLGLCKGGTIEKQDPNEPRPGLSEWLHQGIQRSAGLRVDDPPLTFRDLWNAPRWPGAPASAPCGDADPPSRRAINLQMITTNVTHGRPYRLPLADPASRLFYRPDDLTDYLPQAVIDAMVAVSRRYLPAHSADPPVIKLEPDKSYDPLEADPTTLYELPGADMPVVFAARLSLSFPLLFSAVPLFAIDYERRSVNDRRIRRCFFTDGGLSSNFPIHLFDAALPRWPTFGIWLDKVGPYQRDDNSPVWLPQGHLQGRGDKRDRFDPLDDDGSEGPCPRRSLLSGFLLALLATSADWQDRTSMRLPHVRNRVARAWLRRDEGGLNIGMSRRQILEMAHRYGTTAGKLFVDRFSGSDGQVRRAWSEQRWIRLQLLLDGLRERLNGFADSLAWSAHCIPMDQQIDAATNTSPLGDDVAAPPLSAGEAASLRAVVSEIARLESVLNAAAAQHYKPTPEPELRMRAPL